MIPKAEEIKKILFGDRGFIPVEVCLVPYKKDIRQKRYIQYRRLLSKLLEEHPRWMEKIEFSFFNDQVLAKSRDWYHMSKRLKKKYNIEQKEV